MGEIVVRKHAGRSGRSVFCWRVFREESGLKSHRFQLGKYRTQEAAERAAEHFRKNAERVAAIRPCPICDRVSGHEWNCTLTMEG